MTGRKSSELFGPSSWDAKFLGEGIGGNDVLGERMGVIGGLGEGCFKHRGLMQDREWDVGNECEEKKDDTLVSEWYTGHGSCIHRDKGWGSQTSLV